MDNQFGVIVVHRDSRMIVVYEGKDKELFSVIDSIKNNIDESAEIKLVSEKEYKECRDDIIEVNKLLA